MDTDVVTHSLSHSLIHSLIYPLNRPFNHSIIHLFIHPFTHSFTRSLSHSPTYSLSHSLTDLLTCFLLLRSLFFFCIRTELLGNDKLYHHLQKTKYAGSSEFYHMTFYKYQNKNYLSYLDEVRPH